MEENQLTLLDKASDWFEEVGFDPAMKPIFIRIAKFMVDDCKAKLYKPKMPEIRAALYGPGDYHQNQGKDVFLRFERRRGGILLISRRFNFNQILTPKLEAWGELEKNIKLLMGRATNPKAPLLNGITATALLYLAAVLNQTLESFRQRKGPVSTGP